CSRSTLTIGAVVGRNTVAGTPASRAAHAQASPALPPEAIVTPASGKVPSARWARMKFWAPRALNVPVCCMNSRAKCSPEAFGLPDCAEATATGRTRPAIRAAADSMSGYLSSGMSLPYARTSCGDLDSCGRSHFVIHGRRSMDLPAGDRRPAGEGAKGTAASGRGRRRGWAPGTLSRASAVRAQAEVDALGLLDEADSDERDDAHDDHVDRERQ